MDIVRASVERIVPRKKVTKVWGYSRTSGTVVDGISFNKNAFSSRNVKISAKNNKYGIDTGYFSKALPEVSTIDHEIGHQIHDSLPDANKNKLKEYFKKTSIKDMDEGLSVYSLTNDSEMVAEAYAEMASNPKPRKMAKQIMKILGS